MTVNKPANLPDRGGERGLRLGRKRYSCRLPLALAAKLEALYQMYPGKTRTQLIGDLLGLGLAEVERAWAAPGGTGGFHPDTRQPIYLLTGPFSEFRGLSYKHHLAMERELEKDDPESSYPLDEYTMGDDQ